jgi:LCP family protein required for cell wall assembly
MNRKRPSIDGFVTRRPNNRLGVSSSGIKKKFSLDAQSNRRPLHTTNRDTLRVLGKQQPGNTLGRVDVSESLKGIDNTARGTGGEKQSFWQRCRAKKQLKKLKKSQKPRGRARKLIKWAAIVMTVLILSIGGYTAYKFINAGHSVVQGSIFDIFKNTPLKEDENGRSNFLIVGTSEDDPGHEGADLTDSILVVSIDQDNKNAFMFSVPRDLYVEYGQACFAGYSGKINSYFSCSNEDTTSAAEQDRLVKTQKFIGDIFGLDIQYGVHVDHTVIKEAVNAVGGIDVDVEGSNGDPGVLDRNFDYKCNYKCYYVKYDNGIHHLDGEHALYLAMARGHSAPTYGLGNSNFDREKNQQKILMALREKALSAGTLTNLGAITKLIDALGNNLRTNVKTDEIRTIMQVASEVKSSNIYSLSLNGDDKNDPLLKTGSYGGASVVMPSAGIYEYGDIQAFIQKNVSSDPVIREAAPIVVLNGSGQAGLGKTKADALKEKGYNVVLVDNAPDDKYEDVEIYQIGTDNPETAKKLSEKYNVKIKTSKPPIAVNGNVRFVIIFGAATTKPNN